MNLFDSFRIALQALVAHKLHRPPTMPGEIIGLWQANADLSTLSSRGPWTNGLEKGVNP